MRMRKKPWAKDMIASRTDCVISDPAEHAGKWAQFSKSGEVRVEIGSGKGDYWINMAHMYPEIAFIAVEKSIDCAAISLKKCLDDTTDNMKLIVDDAAKIDEWFAENEIDVIHLNFSDPWPKKRTGKRRLTSSSFLDSYLNVLEDKGKLYFKTDNTGLFEYSLVSMDEKWKLEEVSLNFDSEANDDAISEYERRFREEKVPIKRAVFSKRKQMVL